MTRDVAGRYGDPGDGPGPSPAIPLIIRDAGGGRGTPRRPAGPLGPEAILHIAWRNAGLERAAIRGRDGHTYRIVYGGRPGGSLGPDFTDAVVERDDGTVVRGDIEIHVRESDWDAHGHHNDPRYNGVVLHVVAAASEGRPAVRASGASIPLLALNWKRPASRGEGQATDGQADGPPTPGALGTLDLAAAGLERFHAQAAGIALDIAAFGADQAIWLGVMGALGYPRNKRAFRVLAARVPWDAAAACGDPDELEARLQQAAGFAAGPAGAAGGKTYLGHGPTPAGSPPEWVRPWGRPANSPVTRIRAISRLVPGWARSGGLAAVCAKWVAGVDRPAGLAAMFRPEALAGRAGVALTGRARAAEIVVNVLLPAVFAIATGPGASTRRGNGVALKDRVLELYGTHPRLAENSLTKEAKVALGVDYTVPTVRTACEQQGLVALYREMFRQGVKPRQTRLPGV